MKTVLFLVATCLFAASTHAGSVGKVYIDTSGAEKARGAFETGLAQLHNFEYPSAAKAFREAQALDPSFALAFWGEAMTHNHPIWMRQDRAAARDALAKLGESEQERLAKAKLPIEKDLMRAAHILYGDGDKHDRDDAYAEFMATLWERYPGHSEIGAFYALAILGTAHEGRDYATYMRSAAVSTPLFDAYPEHPGIAHYLIHATDDPIHAPLGYRAALAYSQIAPDAAHAQHMTSHIFLALGLWDRTATANDRAIELVDGARAKSGAQSVGCGHYPSWQMYAYLQQERFEDASRRMALCYERTAADENSWPSALYYMQGLYLFDTDDWDGEVAAYTLDRKHDPEDGFFRDYLAAVGALKRNQIDAEQKVASALSAGDAAISAMAEPDASYSVHAGDRVETMMLQLRGWLMEAKGEHDSARDLLLAAVRIEDGLPFGYGPPSPPKPALEALGEWLIAHKSYAEAAEVFEQALARTPNRRLALRGLERAQAGDLVTRR
ncbi:MAG: hypothetical protein AAF756_01755 [Pseudomonadota bacterium]